jgi:hypothetical protein
MLKAGPHFDVRVVLDVRQYKPQDEGKSKEATTNRLPDKQQTEKAHKTERLRVRRVKYTKQKDKRLKMESKEQFQSIHKIRRQKQIGNIPLTNDTEHYTTKSQ